MEQSPKWLNLNMENTCFLHLNVTSIQFPQACYRQQTRPPVQGGLPLE